MRVLLGAHTIHPTGGGEAGVGWGWTEALARHPGITSVRVFAHPYNRPLIEERLAADPTLSKVRFEWILPRIDPWDPHSPDPKQWIYLRAHYPLWQRAATQVARRFVDDADVAHHVTPATIFLRTFVSQLGIRFVIGPVGGGHAASLSEAARLFGRSRDSQGAFEMARSLALKPMSRGRSLRQRLSEASAVLCANEQTLRLARRYQPRSELMIDSGIRELPEVRASWNPTEPIILWVGKFEGSKNPWAALAVAEELRIALPHARLVMVGDGTQRVRVEEEINKRQLLNVTLMGRINHDQVARLYGSASIFLFTSVRDTFGVQNLEALSHGLPIVYRESSGVAVGDFARGASIGVASGANWAAATVAVSRKLLTDSTEWQARSDAARTAAAGYTWSARADRVFHLYERVLASAPNS